MCGNLPFVVSSIYLRKGTLQLGIWGMERWERWEWVSGNTPYILLSVQRRKGTSGNMSFIVSLLLYGKGTFLLVVWELLLCPLFPPWLLRLGMKENAFHHLITLSSQANLCLDTWKRVLYPLVTLLGADPFS